MRVDAAVFLQQQPIRRRRKLLGEFLGQLAKKQQFALVIAIETIAHIRLRWNWLTDSLGSVRSPTQEWCQTPPLARDRDRAGRQCETGWSVPNPRRDRQQ